MSTMGSVVVAETRLELEEVPCDLCGGRRFRPFWNRMRHGIHLRTVLCEACGLCMTNPRPTPAANEVFYSKLYNQFHARAPSDLSPDHEYVKRSRGFAGTRVALLQRFLPATNPASVFEVGAGVGQFQVAARAATSWRVSGLEPGEGQAGFCKQLGLDVENAFLETATSLPKEADAVVSFHVLEHTLSPMAFLRRARELLAAEGLLYLEVPNLERAGVPLDTFLQLPHLYNFTQATLRASLRRAGFTPVFWNDGRMNLSVVARPGPVEGGPLEALDLDTLAARLRSHDILARVVERIPPLPGLGRVRRLLLDA